MVFIVQGKPREPEGIIKVTKDTRKDALETANDFLNQGIPFVTIIADGRVYTVEEFAMTIIIAITALFALSLWHGDFWRRLLVFMRPLLWPYTVGSRIPWFTPQARA